MKYFYLSLVSLLFLISCSENNDDVTTNEPKIAPTESTINCRVTDGILVFNDVKDYDKAITYLASIGDENLNVWESSMNFKSFRAVNEIQDSAFICDAILGSLVNPEGKVVIGNYLFKLNSTNRNIEVSSYTSQLKSAKLLEVSEPDINLIQKYFFSENYTQESITCDASNLKGFIGNDKDGASYFLGTTGSDIKSKVVYQAAGVYYSLQAKIKYENHVGCSGWVKIGLQVQPGCKYSKKWSSKNHGIGEENQEGNCHDYNYRPYSGMIALDKYRYSVKFYFRDDNSGEYQDGILSINKGY